MENSCHIDARDIVVRRIQLQPPGPHAPEPGWQPCVYRATPTRAVFTVICRRRAPQWWHGTIAVTFLVPCAVLPTCTAGQLAAFAQQRLAGLVYPAATHVFAAVAADFPV